MKNKYFIFALIAKGQYRQTGSKVVERGGCDRKCPQVGTQIPVTRGTNSLLLVFILYKGQEHVLRKSTDNLIYR